MKLESKLETLLPAGDGPFDVTAFELTHDGESWSAKARVKDLVDISNGDDNACNLEVNCTAFADVRLAS